MPCSLRKSTLNSQIPAQAINQEKDTMSFGETLRTAREAKGLTTSQLAATTHILVQVIEGLENENFKRIPAAIYGRGFVKMYCEAVGLDPKPLQAEFSDLYARNKNAAVKASATTPPKKAISESALPAAAEEAVAPAAEEAAPAVADIETPRHPDSPESVAPNQTPDLRLEAEVVRQPSPRRSYGDLFSQSYAEDNEPERPSAADRFRSTMSNVSSGVFANVRKLPPNTGRIATVVVGAAIVVALLSWGIAILYKATTPNASGAESVKPAVRLHDAKPAVSDKATDRKPQPKAEASKSNGARQSKPTQSGDLKSSGIAIPPLYVD